MAHLKHENADNDSVQYTLRFGNKYAGRYLYDSKGSGEEQSS